jgi:anti-anti-sigma regulatory factor
VLDHTGDIDTIHRSSLYTTQVEAVASIWPSAHLASDEPACPLRPLAPHLTELSLHPDGTLRDASRHDLPLCEELAVLRFDGALLFASGSALVTEFERWAAERSTVRGVVLVGTTLTHLDTVRAGHLLEFVKYVRGRGARVALCHVSEPVADVLDRTGVIHDIGDNAFFTTEAQALAAMIADDPQLADDDCPFLRMIESG